MEIFFFEINISDILIFLTPVLFVFLQLTPTHTVDETLSNTATIKANTERVGGREIATRKSRMTRRGNLEVEMEKEVSSDEEDNGNRSSTITRKKEERKKVWSSGSH